MGRSPTKPHFECVGPGRMSKVKMWRKKDDPYINGLQFKMHGNNRWADRIGGKGGKDTEYALEEKDDYFNDDYFK